MLKTKLITNYTTGDFESALDIFINTIGQASIQYRTSPSITGTILHSALIIYEVPDEVEGDKDNE
jgi:hypothetical protein